MKIDSAFKSKKPEKWLASSYWALTYSSPTAFFYPQTVGTGGYNIKESQFI